MRRLLANDPLRMHSGLSWEQRELDDRVFAAQIMRTVLDELMLG